MTPVSTADGPEGTRGSNVSTAGAPTEGAVIGKVQPDSATTAPTATGATKRVAVGVSLILVGLALITVFADALSSTLNEAGVVDRRVVAFNSVLSLIGLISAGLGANVVLSPLLRGHGRWWLQALVFVAVVAIAGAYAWFIYAERPDSEYVEGELSSAEPFAHRVLISGGNGHRYYITFTPSGSLSAEVQLRGGGNPIVGVRQDNGVQVIEGVLVGDTTWTAVLRYLDGEGKYLVFVDSADPEKLTMSSQRWDRSLDVGRSRVGYVFDVAERGDHHDIRQAVFLRVESRRAGQPNPGVILRTATGTPIDNVPVGGDGTIFTKVPPGPYVVEVQGEPGQRYWITLDNENPDQQGTPPTTLPPGPAPSVPVPDVARRPEAEAVAKLTAAGFVVQSYAVCSNSLAQEGAPVGTTRQVVRAGGPAVGEEEVVGLDGVVIDTLPKGTHLDVKVFSGLPCR